MSYLLTKIWLFIYLRLQKSGTILYPKDFAFNVPFSPLNIAYALTYSSVAKCCKLQWTVKLPSGVILKTLWESPLEIPLTIDNASDVIPVFVKN